MKLKIAIIVLLLASFGYLLSKEITSVDAHNNASPTPSPISSPITSPVTSPITFSGFKLQGNVSYRVIKRWFNSLKRFTPAADVTVVAKNRDTGEKTETKTDSDGDYIFTLPSDKYRVTVKSDGHGWFVPPFHNVNLNKDRDSIDFTGFTWDH
jgi:hypothetical protein